MGEKNQDLCFECMNSEMFTRHLIRDDRGSWLYESGASGRSLTVNTVVEETSYYIVMVCFYINVLHYKILQRV